MGEGTSKVAFRLEDSESGSGDEQGEYWVVFNPQKYKAGGIRVESWVDSTVGDALLVGGEKDAGDDRLSDRSKEESQAEAANQDDSTDE